MSLSASYLTTKVIVPLSTTYRVLLPKPYIGVTSGSRTHTVISQGILSNYTLIGLSHHLIFLLRRRSLLPVIKKIYFSGSLYTFQEFTLGLARPQCPLHLSRIQPVIRCTFRIQRGLTLQLSLVSANSTIVTHIYGPRSAKEPYFFLLVSRADLDNL